MKKARVLLILLALGSFFSPAVWATRQEALDKHLRLQQASIFRHLQWEALGPYFTGGRVSDIEGYASRPYKFLVASASGGVWLTENNGTTWTPIFDRESTASIGDIAVSQTDENLVWVGTGEANSSPNTYAGTGVFKSIDNGRSWKNQGLTDSHHIGRIIIDPRDNNTVYVAALGHLYSVNEERGVFKTTDGGKTWQKILFISPRTGVIDLVIDQKNPDTLYAAAWQRERRPWNLTGGGQESGIYKTTDGGKTWAKKIAGLPDSIYLGRIGLTISPGNPQVLYAVVDNLQSRILKKLEDKDAEKDELTIESLPGMSVKSLLEVNDIKLERLLRRYGAPELYEAQMLKRLLKQGQITPGDVARLLSEAREKTQTMVLGAEVYRTDDGAQTWARTHPGALSSDIYKTYGFFFGQVRISPENDNILYLLAIPLLQSVNGGRTFSEISKSVRGLGGDEVHVDSHALWIDPLQPNRMVLGTDGGINITYDRGASWQKLENLPIAQCYTVNYDLQNPYRIYSGLQDNGVVVGPRNYRFGARGNPWVMILGADGASVEVANDNPAIIYAASQFGNLFRLDLRQNRPFFIKPQSADADTPYRFNWLAPFIISRHQPATLYMGANKVLKSIDQGDHWVSISPDITGQLHTDGNVPYATITALAESPLDPAFLCAGTDDGNLWLTQDSGEKWVEIGAVLPAKWISRVVVSRFKKERLYVTMTGHKEDDFKTYIFVSHDAGLNWESLAANLPDEPVNVIREDPGNESLLYIGTDLGVYVSLDMGHSWHSLKNNLPSSPVFDLQVQPRERELIIGTHGRGVFILPLKTIQEIVRPPTTHD